MYQSTVEKYHAIALGLRDERFIYVVATTDIINPALPAVDVESPKAVRQMRRQMKRRSER